MLKKMEKWKNHQFSTGVTRGKDYIQYENDCKAIIKKIALENGLKLHSFF